MALAVAYHKNNQNLLTYCDYFKFILIEELVLETELLQVHFGKCTVIGKLSKDSNSSNVFLENVRITDLPSKYSIPEGTLKICLLNYKHNFPNNTVVEVLGEVVLLSNSNTEFGQPKETTSYGLWTYFKNDSNQVDRDNINLKFSKFYHPAIKVWFINAVANAGDLISRNLEIRMLQQQLDTFDSNNEKMTQCFVESKNKDPLLYNFSNIFEEPFDDIEEINKFQFDFGKKLEESWFKYWNLEGEKLILKAWNEKYKNYLKDNTENKDTDDPIKETSNGEINLVTDESLIQTALQDVEVTDETRRDTHLEADESLRQKESEGKEFEPILNSWDDLWDEHRQDIYSEQYTIFSAIFYNYFLDLKKSLAEIEPESDEEVELLELREDIDQLKLLGLPTSFGGRPQNSSKKSKKHSSKSLHFSDFFSDSDFEELGSDSDMDAISGDIADESLFLHKIEDTAINKRAKKSKKKNRKLKNVPSFMLEEKGLLKYWRKRFSLFSRFDEGIRLDRESWFSVTPEKVAKHLAERLNCNLMVDGFCGSGGNAIQFAQTCDKVIAIDIDPVKLEMAKHNAQIYNVEHKIEFILGDFLQMASSGKLKADTVFLSPPWGGPKYKNKKDYDIEKYLLPVGASELIQVSRNVSENVALFLPRNSNVKQIVRLAGVGNRCEIEHNYLDSRLVAVTALYGEEILQREKSP